MLKLIIILAPVRVIIKSVTTLDEDDANLVSTGCFEKKKTSGTDLLYYERRQNNNETLKNRYRRGSLINSEYYTDGFSII